MKPELIEIKGKEANVYIDDFFDADQKNKYIT